MGCNEDVVFDSGGGGGGGGWGGGLFLYKYELLSTTRFKVVRVL